ncbi:MAG: MerR family transcriptional regulator [Tepidisphaeraceae bacterium]
MSIGELATAAGLTRRAIRFYVSQKLLPVPLGVGRGRHYDASHLERLREIGRLQTAGYSLEQIRRVLAGETGVVAAGVAVPTATGDVPLELWRRLRIGEGVELSFDARQVNPTMEQLMEIRQAVAMILARPEHADGRDQNG